MHRFLKQGCEDLFAKLSYDRVNQDSKEQNLEKHKDVTGSPCV